MTTKKLFWLLVALPFILIGGWWGHSVWQTHQAHRQMLVQLANHGYPTDQLTDVSQVSRTQDFIFDAPSYTMTFRQKHDRAQYTVSDSQDIQGHWGITLDCRRGGVEVWQQPKTLK
jgi:hypothetical protein